MAESLAEVVVESVRVHMLSSQHVVLLKETDRERYLPIWIGPWEANAIATRLQGVTPERPFTHDLFATALAELGVKLQRVIVSSLAEETFHATLELEQGGRTYAIDARPSDALALAVRTGVRIFASTDVLERAGVEPESKVDEKLEVFREFVTRWTWTSKKNIAKGRVRKVCLPSDPRRSNEGIGRPTAFQAILVGLTSQGRGAAGHEGIGRPTDEGLAEDRLASLHGPAAPEPQPEPQAPEVADRPENDLRFGPGLGTRRPRVVRNANLRQPAALVAKLDQQLGREEGAPRRDPNRDQRLALEQLAGAVDVANPDPEEDPVREMVNARIPTPDERVGPPDAIPDNHVRGVGRGEPLRKPGHIRHPELAVAVDEGDQTESSGPEPGAKGRAVAKVGGVVDYPEHVGVLAGELVGDGRRTVARAVVDGDNLELLGQLGEGAQGLIDQSLKIGLLVVSGEEEREFLDTPRRRPRRLACSGARPFCHWLPFRANT